MTHSSHWSMHGNLPHIVTLDGNVQHDNESAKHNKGKKARAKLFKAIQALEPRVPVILFIIFHHFESEDLKWTFPAFLAFPSSAWCAPLCSFYNTLQE